MKKHLHFLLIISIALFSCEKEEEIEEGFGSLSINIGIEIKENPIGGRASEIVPIEEFVVIIQREDGSTFLEYSRAGDLPAEIELPTGNYRVIAHSNNNRPGEFDNPYYYGQTEIFSIDKEEFKSLTVNCEIANMIVTVAYSDNVINTFNSYSTLVTSSTGESLIFNETETREGYFAVNPLSIEATLNYINQDGSTITKTFTGSVDNPQPKTHYEIIVDALIQDGQIAINITLDGTTGTEVINIGDGSSTGNTDSDNDTVLDNIDNCPFYSNPDQADNDGDGAGDICDCDATDPAITYNCYIDNDSDGVAMQAGDCDDSEGSSYPGNDEVCGDGIDNNCNGSIDEGCGGDNDGDGYSVADGDCDDSDGTVYPGALELVDGKDNDCDTIIDEATCGDGVIQPGEVCDGQAGCNITCSDIDADGDGFTIGDGDCNDSNGMISPGAFETCNDGVDNDCDGIIDNCPFNTDDDGDGWSEADGDCNDFNPSIHPGAADPLGDGIDQNCDGYDGYI